jgi:hypothetical protein
VPVDPDDVLPIWQLGDRHGLSGPTSLLIQAAIDQGIAEAAIADAIQFVRERATIRRNYTTVALTPGIVKEQQDIVDTFHTLGLVKQQVDVANFVHPKVLV